MLLLKSYQKLIKFFLHTTLIALVLVSLTPFTRAQQEKDEIAEINVPVIVFYLIYDNGKLSIDPAQKNGFKIDLVEILDENIRDYDLYKVEVFSQNNTLLGSFPIDQRNNDLKFTKGIITPKIPYLENAKIARFYSNKSFEPILSINLDCPKNCKIPTLDESSLTKVEKKSSIWIYIIIFGLASILGLIIFFIVLRKRKLNSENE